MGAFLSLPASLLNALLPFTNKSTPLFQDLIHTAILCGTLYFAPQIADFYNSRQNPDHPSQHEVDIPDTGEGEQQDDVPDRNWVLQDDGAEVADQDPPPLAPTPPPGQAADPEAAFRARVEDEPPFIPPDTAQAQNLPGPANANERPRPTAANRTIGAKKAKSLARKDQRRAYHEFHRQEAELRRQREAEGKEEREAALAVEKARRAEATRVIQEREREERERKKEVERVEQEEERQRRERAVRIVRKGMEKSGAVDLVDVAIEEGKDRVWIERLVRASGLLGQMSKNGGHAMITEAGWAVKLDANFMREVYAGAVQFGNANEGRVGFEEFGRILEKAVRARNMV